MFFPKFSTAPPVVEHHIKLNNRSKQPNEGVDMGVVFVYAMNVYQSLMLRVFGNR